MMPSLESRGQIFAIVSPRSTTPHSTVAVRCFEENMPQTQTCTVELEDVQVECTQCGVCMTTHLGSGQQVRYYYCPSCTRWTTSVYTEVLRGDTKLRQRRTQPSAPVAQVGSVKERLEVWLRSLTVGNPYQALGVAPSISETALRERYLALARAHHPDRGGSAEDMRRINVAYAQIRALRDRGGAQDQGLRPLPAV